MVPKIRTAAVLGAGVMGSGIAAHLANAGIPCLMLDVVPAGAEGADRNRFAARGLDGIRQGSPPQLYAPKRIGLISIGNFEDDLAQAARCDWVIEAVTEEIAVKRALYARIEPLLAPDTIVTSNTSGLPLAQLTEGRTEAFRRRFLVSHFFNPVRYMKLLELVAGPDTDPDALRDVAECGERKLGKGIVYGKDTPNFIGNRIGIFAVMHAMHSMIEDGLTVEAVDKILGPATGRPKSAVFGTADLVGVDTLLRVADHCHYSLPDDPARKLFAAPPFLREMVSRGMLGRKSGGGFFRLEGKGGKKQKLVLDPGTLDYRIPEKVEYPSLSAAKNEDDVGARIRGVISGDDAAAKFAWKVISATLRYAAKKIPEIADDVFNIDNAMKWGFNWTLGPFETWDAIGVAESVARMHADKKAVPKNVENMLASGASTFYRRVDGGLEHYDFAAARYVRSPVSHDVIFLPALKERNKVVRENAGATLYDMGADVLCFEFRTKMNTVDADVVAMMHEAVSLAEDSHAGLVIGNHSDTFSAGANLMLIFMEAQAGNFGNIEKLVRGFQAACMRLRHSGRPVVAALAGLALGGGTEICLGADRIRAAAESYMGLVEAGVGLLPAGGGCKEMVLRTTDAIPEGVAADPLPFLRRAFETIGMAKVSSSAEDARALGFLRPWDRVTIQRDFLLKAAKDTVLAMNLDGYEPEAPRADIVAAGRDAYASFCYGLYAMKEAHQISPHDELIGRKIARVLTGGDVVRGTRVSEQDLLDLELEGFLSLCGEEKTRDRISHMLMNGKPLRN
jgi:3-hydroxyacyl-CoA dehydrogenase